MSKLTDGQLKEAKIAFKYYDSDKNGIVSLKEAEAALESIGLMCKELEKYAKNGKLSLEHFLRATAKAHQLAHFVTSCH
eukprot:m.11136 g.11136  ORF g.11136 m.11136 type:complete len:79 (+) comp3781_c0_seq1:192-428(+)